MKKLSSLSGKVAVITGSASGIGKAMAKRFLQDDARVVIADMRLDAAQETAKELDSSLKSTHPLEMDVTSESQVENGIANAISHFGAVDILVSNAGIQIVASVDQFHFEQWKKMLAIQLDGAFLTTRSVLKHMYKRKKGGSIVYTGSVHSKEASPLKAPYVTSKHGLLGLARVVAKEGAVHNVRANVICPGFVRTPLVNKQIPEQAKELGISEEEVIKNVMLGQTIDGQFTTLEEVAEVTAFVAGFNSNALSGQSFVVSHGWFME